MKRYKKMIKILFMNLRNIFRIIGEDKEQKVSRLLDFSEHPRDIADPRYTRIIKIWEGCIDVRLQ